MAIRIIPSQPYLQQCLNYFPLTGILIWLFRPREHFSSEAIWKMWNTQFAGKVAGGVNKNAGKLYVVIDGRNFHAPRIIYKWMTGIEPPSEIDHIDHEKLNNRWTNLRPATHTQNVRNSRIRRDNTVGFKGVSLSRHKTKFRAKIRVDGQPIPLGNFPTAEEAHAAYCEAGRRLHGEFFYDGGRSSDAH